VLTAPRREPVLSHPVAQHLATDAEPARRVRDVPAARLERLAHELTLGRLERAALGGGHLARFRRQVRLEPEVGGDPRVSIVASAPCCACHASARCEGVRCVAGGAVSCDDGDACTVDTCAALLRHAAERLRVALTKTSRPRASACRTALAEVVAHGLAQVACLRNAGGGG